MPDLAEQPLRRRVAAFWGGRQHRDQLRVADPLGEHLFRFAPVARTGVAAHLQQQVGYCVAVCGQSGPVFSI
jgi:hypothetical protein